MYHGGIATIHGIHTTVSRQRSVCLQSVGLRKATQYAQLPLAILATFSSKILSRSFGSKNLMLENIFWKFSRPSSQVFYVATLGWSINFQLLFFISFCHLKIMYEMKKKKSSQNLHDVKKYIEVGTVI